MGYSIPAGGRRAKATPADPNAQQITMLGKIKAWWGPKLDRETVEHHAGAMVRRAYVSHPEEHRNRWPAELLWVATQIVLVIAVTGRLSVELGHTLLATRIEEATGRRPAERTVSRALMLLRRTGLLMVDQWGSKDAGYTVHRLAYSAVAQLTRIIQTVKKDRSDLHSRNRNGQGRNDSSASAPRGRIAWSPMGAGGLPIGVGSPPGSPPAEPPARYEPATRAQIEEARALYLLLMEGKRIVAAEKRAGSA